MNPRRRALGRRLGERALVAAVLNDPSSGVVFQGRVYFIESKYSLLFPHENDDAAVPRNVPFALQSVPLPNSSRPVEEFRWSRASP